MRCKLQLSNKQEKKIKIVIGAAGTKQSGWVTTDEYFLNLLSKKQWSNLFNKESLDAILAEHVWEHLLPEDGEKAAKICYEYLKKDGYLRMAVPDGYHFDNKYINYVGIDKGKAYARGHKILFNYKTLTELLEKAGFKIKLLEYFDENKKFNFNSWNINDGFIHRSIRYDQRNKDGQPNYTSLIIDAIKK